MRTGIILAGGKSSRMGTDKALLMLGNRSFVHILYDTLKLFCDQIVISANNPEIGFSDSVTVPDQFLNIGPIAGLQSALSASKNEWNFVVSVDTPFITAEFAEFLFAKQKANSHIIVPKINNEVEPLLGWYNRSVLFNLEQAIEKQQLSLRKFALSQRVEIIEITNDNSFFHPYLCKNINTPADLQDAIDYFQKIQLNSIL